MMWKQTRQSMEEKVSTRAMLQPQPKDRCHSRRSLATSTPVCGDVARDSIENCNYHHVDSSAEFLLDKRCDSTDNDPENFELQADRNAESNTKKTPSFTI